MIMLPKGKTGRYVSGLRIPVSKWKPNCFMNRRFSDLILDYKEVEFKISKSG